MTRRVVPMDVRLMIGAIEAVDDGSLNVTEVCRQLRISRDTYYRYRRRLRVEGFRGALPLSTRPATSPGLTPPEVVAVVVAKRAELAAEGLDAGARSIQYRLARTWPDGLGLTPGSPVPGLPSARTVHRVLVREGLVEPQPAKRPRSSLQRFEHPAPNACWQLDGTGWHLSDGTLVCILRVIDDHSRLILASRAAPDETTTEAWALMETALARHGRPVMLLSDGGTAFTSRRTTGGVNEFERRLRDQGINPVVSSPAHPQTCGKKERDWQPLKRWLTAHPAPATRAELQALLDVYDTLFNTDRPHQGINGQLPAERYLATPKAVPAPGPLPPPISIRQQKARSSGHVDLGNRYHVNLGHQWTGATLTVVRDDLEVAILHNDTVIKRLSIDPDRTTQPSGLPRGRKPKLLSDKS